MLLTLVAACLCAVAKWLQPHVDGHSLKLLLIAVPFVILGFVAVWAVLGMGHPRLGVVAVLLLAPLLGLSLKAVLGLGRMGAGYWIAATTTAALVLVASLYVIRHCGFQVRRQSKGESALSSEHETA
jgi:O-antigen/teichoic acid export membrane protein